MSIELVMPPNHFILCQPFLLPSRPENNPTPGHFTFSHSHFGEMMYVLLSIHAIQPQLLVSGLEVSYLHVTTSKRSYLSPTLNGQHRL